MFSSGTAYSVKCNLNLTAFEKSFFSFTFDLDNFSILRIRDSNVLSYSFLTYMF